MNRRDFLTLFTLAVPGAALPVIRCTSAALVAQPPGGANLVSSGGDPASPAAVAAPATPPVVIFCGLGANARGRLRHVLTPTGQVQTQRLSLPSASS